jgi:hypothetical protein
MTDGGDLEDRIERAEERWQEVSCGAPSGDHEWGFFNHVNGPAASRVGVGMFTWFRDRDSMLTFIEETLPYCAAGRSRQGMKEIAAETSAVVEKVRIGRFSECDGIRHLNRILQASSQFKWIGTVTDLLDGDQPYVTEVRMAFRSVVGEESDGEPVSEKEKDDFFQFLNAWGV